ncbi:antitoxin [Fodinicola acaciae]|uniref:antitoxin n=1 Tax=Fodinicola acaciae TaxID=2681555 RepID=UPI0013D4ABCB|nr:antitoxin [Fodinicola acaciae]
MSMFDDAKKFIDEHDEQVDQVLDKAGEFANEKTGGQYGDQIQQGVDFAQQHTGDGDTTQGQQDQQQ